MPPTRPGALPVYLQIAERLTRDIRARTLQPGRRLPPEREMARALGVTVTTLRKALTLLEERGLLQRRHGSGNYILDGRTDLGTYALFGLELITGGGLPTAQVLSVQQHPSPEHAAALGPSAWNIRRVRALDGLDVAIEDIFVSMRYAGSLSSEILSDSLYHSYRHLLELEIARAEDRLGVGDLPNWAAPHVSFAEPQKLGLVRRRAFDGYGALAEVSTTWFDPSRATYVARIP